MESKEYSNGEITIVWKPELCQHAGICVQMLPLVYNPREKPWIKTQNASSEALIDQVSKCPSGALSIKDEYTVSVEQEDDGKKGRFSIKDKHHFIGELTYVWAAPSMFIIDHTAVEVGYEGKGYGKMLVMKAIEFARENNFKIMPLCPYAKRVFDKNPNFDDIKA